MHRAADRGAVAAPVGEYLLPPLLAEGIEALAAELQQLVALGIAQFLPAHQGVAALLAAVDAVASEQRCPGSGGPRPALVRGCGGPAAP